MDDYLGNIKIIHDLNSMEVGFACQICEGSQCGTPNGFPVCNSCKSILKHKVTNAKNGISDFIPYQMCPNCNGKGFILDTCITDFGNKQCTICEGKQIIPMYVQQL